MKASFFDCVASFYLFIYWTGAKHVSVNRGIGQADSERLTICREDGEPDEGVGIEIQASGRESQTTPGKTV